jgi:hypothetical protein
LVLLAFVLAVWLRISFLRKMSAEMQEDTLEQLHNCFQMRSVASPLSVLSLDPFVVLSVSMASSVPFRPFDKRMSLKRNIVLGMAQQSINDS